MKRKEFLKWLAGGAIAASVAVAFVLPCAADELAQNCHEKTELAHALLMSNFVSSAGHLIEYVGELPTPEDCARCFPNGNGYHTPISNGSMFTGTYLGACIARAARLRGTPGGGAAADEVRRLARGLLHLAFVSDVPGMVARGVGTDGRCHYASGTVDQTLPWLMGLRAYVRSPFCPEGEKAKVRAKMLEVIRAVEKLGWRIPADGAFKGQSFGGLLDEGLSWNGGTLAFRASVHYLFLLRVAYELSGDPSDRAKYLAARDGKYPKLDLTRLEILERGWEIDAKDFPCEKDVMWIYVATQEMLVELIRAEDDPHVAARYRKGLEYNARRARPQMANARTFDNRRENPFKFANWRTGYAWRPQKTLDDALVVARTGNAKILGSRKDYLRHCMSTPLSAAAICAIAGLYHDEVRATICAYDYRQIEICEFFLAEVANEWMINSTR